MTRFCATAKVKKHFKPVYSNEALKANVWNSEFGISVDAFVKEGKEVFEVWLTRGRDRCLRNGECQRICKLGWIDKDKFKKYLEATNE